MINGDDLRRVFKHLSPAEISAIIASINTDMASGDGDDSGGTNGSGWGENNQGMISWEQFSGAMRAEAVVDDDLRGAFEMYDTNRDGKITLDELYNTLQGFGLALSKDQVEVSLRNADTNGDQEIDFEEFRRLFHASAAAPPP